MLDSTFSTRGARALPPPGMPLRGAAEHKRGGGRQRGCHPSGGRGAAGDKMSRP